MSELSLVRSYGGDVEDYALVRAPDGFVYRLRVMDVVGKEGGHVAEIAKGRLTITLPETRTEQARRVTLESEPRGN